MTRPKKVAILMFPDVELIDLCGPFEVFSITGKRGILTPFNVFTVAERRKPITTSNNMSINPQYGFADCPRPDVLVVPGGIGTRKEMNNPILVNWVREQADAAEMVVSVCTGALIMAKAGLFSGLDVTTHHNAIDILKQIAPDARVHADRRFIDNGKIIVAAGISSGIDASFHAVRRLAGEELARETAYHMEYDWKPDSAAR